MGILTNGFVKELLHLLGQSITVWLLYIEMLEKRFHFTNVFFYLMYVVFEYNLILCLPVSTENTFRL